MNGDKDIGTPLLADIATSVEKTYPYLKHHPQRIVRSRNHKSPAQHLMNKRRDATRRISNPP